MNDVHTDPNQKSKQNTRSLFYNVITSPFLKGLFAILPIALTVSIVIWIAQMIEFYIGPESYIGKNIISVVGERYAPGTTFSYVVGFILFLSLIYVLGGLIDLGLKNTWNKIISNIFKRIPLVGMIFDASNQLMTMFDSGDNEQLKAMTPVVCYFGGEGGTAVLALMPNPKAILLDGREYYGVMIPTAPIPFGGALLYVPVEWVKPTDFNIDGLVNIYMSMGATAPTFTKEVPGSKIDTQQDGDNNE
jgi:uncharacterized membrane protein